MAGMTPGGHDNLEQPWHIDYQQVYSPWVLVT